MQRQPIEFIDIFTILYQRFLFCNHGLNLFNITCSSRPNCIYLKVKGFEELKESCICLVIFSLLTLNLLFCAFCLYALLGLSLNQNMPHRYCSVKFCLSCLFYALSNRLRLSLITTSWDKKATYTLDGWERKNKQAISQWCYWLTVLHAIQN